MDVPEGTIYDFSAQLLDGRALSLEEFRGQVLLIVNTASKCGFTPQYAGLEAPHEKLHGDGFSVLGFPCNQFGGQEPGSAAEIGAFCETQYAVSFPIFAKIDVNGQDAHPLFKFLKSRQSGVFGALGMDRIKWNFTKFLIDRKGQPVSRHSPSTNPAELASAIEALL